MNAVTGHGRCEYLDVFTVTYNQVWFTVIVLLVISGIALAYLKGWR